MFNKVIAGILIQTPRQKSPLGKSKINSGPSNVQISANV